MYRDVDFLSLESELTDDERQIRDIVRSFVDREFLPQACEYYEQGQFPTHLITKMAQIGLFGANLTGYDLPGIGNVAYGLALQELERGDSALRSFVSVQSALCMYPIWAFGSEEQQRHWLPRLAGGAAVACFGLTEAGFGSNPAGLQTTARPSADGTGWIVSGSKMWITNGTMAQVAIIWAKADGRVQGFLVETDRPGFHAVAQKYKLSMRISDTAELFLDDVEIPRENHLPGATDLKHALMCLDQARFGIAWGVIGAAAHCYETALNYGRTRIVFDQPINRYQLYQEKLHYMIREISLMQLLALRLGRLKDAGTLHHTQTSLAKQNNVEKALAIARLAREMLGANGISGEYPVMRHLCNLETVYTYEGTNDIHKLIVGQAVTGLAAFTVGQEDTSSGHP
ncbi:MAG: acyl-CoA dehydrogenase family protein [Planctomycetes bacterium]|nr:acyl-CoA dehydrogenase family protein [Planctomycetota bacterium]